MRGFKRSSYEAKPWKTLGSNPRAGLQGVGLHNSGAPFTLHSGDVGGKDPKACWEMWGEWEAGGGRDPWDDQSLDTDSCYLNPKGINKYKPA